MGNSEGPGFGVQSESADIVVGGQNQHSAGPVDHIRRSYLFIAWPQQRIVVYGFSGPSFPDAEYGADTHGDVDIRGAVQRVHQDDVAVGNLAFDYDRVLDLFAPYRSHVARLGKRLDECVGTGCVQTLDDLTLNVNLASDTQRIGQGGLLDLLLNPASAFRNRHYDCFQPLILPFVPGYVFLKCGPLTCCRHALPPTLKFLNHQSMPKSGNT